MEEDLYEVKRILDSGEEPFKFSQGSSICLAAQKRLRNIVELLLQHGFDVDHEDDQGHTPIYYSVVQNDVETTELLLQNGAEPNGNFDLISLAAKKGFGSIVKVLVDCGADVNRSDDCGLTPLHQAILTYSALFTLLRETSMIRIRAMKSVVHVLLSKGSNVNAKTVDGFSPLHFAIILKYPIIVSILLKQGADCHSLVNCENKSPYLSQCRLKSGRSDTSGRLTKEPRLTTVLHIAVKSNDIASIFALLKAGAKVDSVRYDGKTPLILAIKSRNNTVVRVLLGYGADIEKKYKYGLTPLHVACQKGSVNVLKSLLEYGANINATCNIGKVPYHYVLQFEENVKIEHFYRDYFDKTTHYYQQLYTQGIAMKKTLQTQLNMMYINGLYLQNYNKELTMKTQNNFHGVSKKDVEDFSKHFVVCNETGLTLYSLINKFRNPSYIRHPIVFKGLDLAIAVTNAKYPGLGNVLMFLRRSARVRTNLIDKGIEWFIHLNQTNNSLPSLPFDVLQVVFSFLLDDDIRTFISCFEGPGGH